MERPHKRSLCRTLAVLCACAASLAGCGATSNSPRVVQLTVTAPIDGVFRQPLSLHRGLNHIELLARAAGYVPTRTALRVRSSGGTAGALAIRSLSPTRTTSRDFAHAASAICARNSARSSPIARSPGGPSRQRALAVKALFLRNAEQLSKLSPPPALRAGFDRYVRVLRFIAGQMDQVAIDLGNHDMAAAKRDGSTLAWATSLAKRLARRRGPRTLTRQAGRRRPGAEQSAPWRQGPNLPAWRQSQAARAPARQRDRRRRAGVLSCPE